MKPIYCNTGENDLCNNNNSDNSLIISSSDDNDFKLNYLNRLQTNPDQSSEMMQDDLFEDSSAVMSPPLSTMSSMSRNDDLIQVDQKTTTSLKPVDNDAPSEPSLVESLLLDNQLASKSINEFGPTTTTTEKHNRYLISKIEAVDKQLNDASMMRLEASNIDHFSRKSRSSKLKINVIVDCKPMAHILVFLFGVVLLASQCPVTWGLDCFVCSSRNGSDPSCEDPFHNLHPIRVTTPVIPERYKPRLIYHSPCVTSRKNRHGLFPASACVKLAGTFENGETLIVRHCGLDSGTLTQDTEIVRMSHCGGFQLDGHHLKGCVMACATDACNGSLSQVMSINHSILMLMLCLATLMSIRGITTTTLAQYGLTQSEDSHGSHL